MEMDQYFSLNRHLENVNSTFIFAFLHLVIQISSFNWSQLSIIYYVLSTMLHVRGSMLNKIELLPSQNLWSNKIWINKYSFIQ